MVLEQFLESEKIKNHLLYVSGLGFFYVFFSFFVAKLFFGASVSVAMLFTCTLLLVPSLNYILNIEEKIESKVGVKHFFRNHKDIIDIYLVLFIGIFFGYLILGAFFADLGNDFSYQVNFLEREEGLNKELIDDFAIKEYNPTMQNFYSLISWGLAVILICFLLSIFYGSGAIFLITLNASIFSTFIVYILQYVGRSIGMVFSVLGLFLIHMIPEIAGFMMAAIAGGVVSRAITREKFGSEGFKNVMKDAVILLLIGIGLIIISAFLEIFVTSRFVYGLL